MNKIEIAKRISTAAVGLGVVTCVSNIIAHKTVSNMPLPAKAATIVGAFVLGSIVLDATQNGVEAQITEIAAKIKNRKK